MVGSHHLRHLIAAALLAFAGSTAHASRVSPMSVELEPFGRDSIARIQFTNTADRDFPLEVRAFRGDITEDGELTLTPADEDFLIFPPQLVVAPLKEQVIRIQYVGNPNPAQAQVYYLSVRQLPVELEPGAPQIQVTVTFNVFVDVEPEGLEAIARVDTISPAEREGETGIEVRVANDGNGMLLAGRRDWVVSGKRKNGDDFNLTLNAAQMSSTIGVGVVAPGKARRFFLPLDPDVDPETVIIALS